MGHLRKRGNSYQITIYTPNGRYHESVRGSKAQAKARMLEVEAARVKGVEPPRNHKLTLGQHLGNWLEYQKTQVSLRTFDGYESMNRVHLKPALGDLTLRDLRPEAIQAYYARVCTKVSARTVGKHHRLLFSALKYAVRQGIVGRNVMELIDPPRWKPKAMRTLTPDELATLLEHCTDGIHPIVYTAVSSGLRQAEILGLRWRDIDLELGSISINQVLYMRRGMVEFKEPKTARSRRRVTMTKKLAAFLDGYKKDRKLLGMPVGPDDLVFCHRDGAPFSPSTLDHAFTATIRKAGLTGLRFHDLRHTFASLALMRGAKPKVISEALGHSSVGFTLDVYSHTIEGMQDEMATLLDDIMPSGTRGSGITL